MTRAAIALLVLAGAAAAQEDLEAKLAAKLSKPFVKNADWVLDFDEARRKSKELNKPIFAYFTRSDQPDPGSAQVEDGVFSSEAFAKLSKDFVVFLHVTTRIPGRKDDMLLFRLGGRSFPFVAILDPYGGILAEHRAPPMVEAFQKTAEPARTYFDLRAKALGGDREAALELAMTRARKGQITSRRLRREVGRLGELTEDQSKAYKALLTELMMEEASLYAEGGWFAKMEKEGLVPSDPREKIRFHVAILARAEFDEDVAEAERILGKLRELAGEEPEARGFFLKAEARIAELKRTLEAEKPKKRPGKTEE